MTVAVMRHIVLTEGGPAQVLALSRPQVDALLDHELVDVAATTDAGLWEVVAAKKVGAARVGDLQVTVKPKVELSRLIFMLGYAMNPSGWSQDQVALEEDDDLWPAMAEAYGRLASKTLEQGVLQGYRTLEESGAVLRGRLRENDQIRRHFGVLMPLEIRYDEFTIDVAENQILLSAAMRLLRLPRLSMTARQRLLRLHQRLADVTVLSPGVAMPHWVPSRLNIRYHSALKLAAVIMAGDSFEQRVGELKVSGFMFDMWRVYEDFLSAALLEAFSEHGGRSSLQENWVLDVDEAIKMRPDFVWYEYEAPTVVIDAKYKADKPAGFPDADLYQMLAYCTASGLSDGHLVYARGFTERPAYEIRNAGVYIHCHSLDLSASPGAILDQVQVLVDQIIASTRPGTIGHPGRADLVM